MAKTKIKLQDLVKTLKKVFGLVAEYKKFLIWGTVIILFIELLEIIGMYIFKDIVDALVLLQENNNLQHIIILVVAMSLTYFIVSIINYFNDSYVVSNEIKMSHMLYIKIYNKLIGLSLGYHEKENTGAKLNKIENGINSIRTIVQHLLWDFAPTVIRIFISFIFLLFINVYVALIFLIIIPLFLIITYKTNIKTYSVRQNIRKGYEKVYGKFGQAIYNVKTVQAYAQENREMSQAKKGIWGIIRNQVSYIKILFSSNFQRFNIITIGQALVIISGVYLAYHGRITTGELVFFLSISGNCYWSLYSLSRIVDRIMEAKVSVERIIKILDQENDLTKKQDAPKIDIDGELEFKNVTFNYGEGNVLKNINFHIKPGETIALVGPSGGGKTTVAKLIYRYFDTIKGTILVDGNDIRDIDLEHYRKQLGIVSQDIDIFNDSVADNIAYGNPKATLADIKKAAKIANADEFINKFEKKYKTIVGERGIKLSGGQKQRIGIARAVLVDPKIIILDEATSSLDAESERQIQDAINHVIKNRTTIIIAHRLSTIKNADRIIVIDKGKIIQEGTHKQLARKSGLYSKLIKLQISGYLS